MLKKLLHIFGFHFPKQTHDWGGTCELCSKVWCVDPHEGGGFWV